MKSSTSLMCFVIYKCFVQVPWQGRPPPRPLGRSQSGPGRGAGTNEPDIYRFYTLSIFLFLTKELFTMKRIDFDPELEATVKFVAGKVRKLEEKRARQRNIDEKKVTAFRKLFIDIPHDALETRRTVEAQGTSRRGPSKG